MDKLTEYKLQKLLEREYFLTQKIMLKSSCFTKQERGWITRDYNTILMLYDFSRCDGLRTVFTLDYDYCILVDVQRRNQKRLQRIGAC